MAARAIAARIGNRIALIDGVQLAQLMFDYGVGVATDKNRKPLIIRGARQIGKTWLMPIVCAGSLLGVALHQGTSFPVGKVEFLDLYPLSFSEFMFAIGQEHFIEILQKRDFAMATTFRHHLCGCTEALLLCGRYA